MDETGFAEHMLKKKRSPRGIDFYINILKRYGSFLQKHRGHSDIDSSSSEDLIAFGQWLEEENFQKTLVNLYKQVLREYFTFIEKEDLADIAANGFTK